MQESTRGKIDWRFVISGVVTLAVLCALMKPLFAVAFLIAIYVHEVGHAEVLKALGHPAPRLLFLPFIGGIAIPQGEHLDPREVAWFALGGPLVGTAVALLAWPFKVWTGSHFLHAFVLVGLLLNLLNMVPLFPLDGGKIAQVIDRRLMLLGVPLGVVGFLLSSSWRDRAFLALFVLFTTTSLWRYFRNRNILVCPRCETKNRVGNYDDERYVPRCGNCKLKLATTRTVRFRVATAYFGLLAVQIVASLLFLR